MSDEICKKKDCEHLLALHSDVHCAGSDWCVCRGVKVAKAKPEPVKEDRLVASLETEEFFPGRCRLGVILSRDRALAADDLQALAGSVARECDAAAVSCASDAAGVGL